MSATQVTTPGIANDAVTIDKINFENALVPIGGIIMWSGVYTPKGWVFCNGNNGEQINGLYIPDLRNKFIVGSYNVDYATTPKQGPIINPVGGGISRNYEPGDTGGESAHKLTISEIPNRTGSVDSGARNYILPSGVFDIDRGVAPSNTSGGGGGDLGWGKLNFDLGGGDNYHENRPPYYALAFIMRVS